MTVLPRINCPQDEEFELWLELLSVKPSLLLLHSLGDSLESYLHQSGREIFVLGLSGGLDSSFLAALLHWRKVPFLGFCLPLPGTSLAEAKRALEIAQAYTCLPSGETFHPEHDFSMLYGHISQTFAAIFPGSTPLAEGNLKARLRMMFLYHCAQLHGGCVLGTDQLDELLTGFWTLHGDVGDVCPIQLIPKSTEYGLARLLCDLLDNPAPLQAAIEAVPTDGLGIGTSDWDQLQVSSYAELESLFQKYFALRARKYAQGLSSREQGLCNRLETVESIRRFLATRHKRTGAVLFDPRGVC